MCVVPVLTTRVDDTVYLCSHLEADWDIIGTSGWASVLRTLSSSGSKVLGCQNLLSFPIDTFLAMLCKDLMNINLNFYYFPKY